MKIVKQGLGGIVALASFLSATELLADELEGARRPQRAESSGGRVGGGAPTQLVRSPERYGRAGVESNLDGIMLFTGGRFATLFFILDQAGKKVDGRSHAGRYRIDSNRLIFEHEWNLEASPGEEPSLEPSSGEPEVTRFSREGDQLRVRFPSGNWIGFEKMAP